MTKMDIGEYKHLLSQMKELKLTLGLSFTGTNGTIEEFSGDTKLKGVAWSSTKSYFSAGYTPMLDGLSDVFYTAITTLENFIRAFESEVTASGVKLDLDHLEDLQRRRDELQREKTNWLHQIAEQASKIPGLGHLFDDYSVLQAEKKVQLMEDFRDFIHRHDSDFSELNGLIEQVLLGLEELGKQRSFNGDKQGYSPINFMNLNWSKNLASYHKKHGEEVKKIQKKDLENFKNMAEVAAGAAAMESFGANVELDNMGSSLYSASKDYFSKDGISGGNSGNLRNSDSDFDLDHKKVQKLFNEFGEELMTIKDLKKIKLELQKINIDVTFDKKNKILKGTIVAGFDSSTGTIYIKKNPTKLSVLHEAYHAEQFTDLGKPEYLKLSTIEKEEYVFKQIMESNLFNTSEKLSAQKYIFKLRNGYWPPADWKGFN
ncbi:conserved hypothetical protein [Carnobacterium maltaromaticum]|uniref:zincin-like metallopeptidase toxin domain-containing protein n=1 Tax=Carnobacterium maltaromaticum TaxID=2751 RepID=UPI00191B9584|nr:zincin-like metallopeptidase toxin domain-containing protein [Carnobacterium maltaromaticum]CAD5899479.1 conserved hypothetical protein [Carnobacterium maltaromaticum]